MAVEERGWVDFLVGLRYNAEMDEELAVNEFRYMATERKLFEASETARLKQLQLRFSRDGRTFFAEQRRMEDARCVH